MQKPKIKLQIVIFFEFWVVFIVSYFVGNPVHVTTEPIVYYATFVENLTWSQERFMTGQNVRILNLLLITGNNLLLLYNKMFVGKLQIYTFKNESLETLKCAFQCQQVKKYYMLEVHWLGMTTNKLHIY